MNHPRFQCPKGATWGCCDEVLVHTYNGYFSPIESGQCGLVASFHAKIPMNPSIKDHIGQILKVPKEHLPEELTLTVQDKDTQGDGSENQPQLQLKPQWCFANRHKNGTTKSIVKADIAILDGRTTFKKLPTMKSSVSLHPWGNGAIRLGRDPN
ncbi:MAG: hypothetical protein LBT69_03555, partial [Lactobacillales bacterium]|nr:hypothetical protein [Lactobacillales bacterium]